MAQVGGLLWFYLPHHKHVVSTAMDNFGADLKVHRI
jgi:hypothetical protein